jgi:hypothetical protein
MMRAHKRLQINVQILPFPGAKEFQNIRKGGFYMPVIFVDENCQLPAKLVHEYKTSVGLFQTVESGCVSTCSCVRCHGHGCHA